MTMTRTATWQRRVARLLRRDGETLTFNGDGGAARPVTGLVSVADPDTLAAFFDPATAAGLPRPVLALTLDGRTVPPGPSDTLSRDGRTLSVRAVSVQRWAGVPVACLVLLA